ncbi:preprotein translocase subunit SecG [Persephonella sp. KM09-Lau-8]|uniref:preprotein translocase subunit SecG n=1 Tax=Persephonella sp. KM09-Lau-8 TaxID=1158345 RepID=UPI000495894B|nr:preprotein translocase subunit SecG [Persephonella sp. KM09-Lau-8]
MEILFTILSILLVIDAVLLIIIVLMQKTKGAEIGAIFGSGAAAAVLGAGASNILTKITYWLGGIFLFLVFALSYIHHKSVTSGSVVTDIPAQQTPVEKHQEQTK